VDTHWQSEVGFAFGKLLSFELMPWLKNLYKQKLSLPFPEDADKYPNLATILRKEINWQLIREQYPTTPNSSNNKLHSLSYAPPYLAASARVMPSWGT
jgi:TnpA family transposase